MQGAENLWYQYRLGDEGIKSSPAQKDLGVLVDERLDTTQPSTHSLESQTYPGLHLKQIDPQGHGGHSGPLRW